MFLNFDDKEERDRLPPKTVTSYDERAGLRYEEYFEQFVLYPYLWKMKSHLMITLIKKQREHIRGKKSSVQTRSFTKSSSNSNRLHSRWGVFLSSCTPSLTRSFFCRPSHNPRAHVQHFPWSCMWPWITRQPKQGLPRATRSHRIPPQSLSITISVLTDRTWRLPHRLDLKKNCICAIQPNLSVENYGQKRARARDCTASSIGRSLNTFESHCVPRINFSFHPNRPSWTVNRRRFPLRLAYATTFHGRQGLPALASTALDLRTDPFTRGQVESENVKRHIMSICRGRRRTRLR